MIDIFSIQKTIKVLGENYDLTVQFIDGLKTPHTDGKNVVLPKPLINYSPAELEEWYFYAYHEMRHNRPETKGHIALRKKSGKKYSNFFNMLWNLVEDHRIEYNRYDDLAGERGIIARGRRDFSRRAIADIAKTGTKDLDENVYKFQAVYAFTDDVRQVWQPEMEGVYIELLEVLPEQVTKYFNKLYEHKAELEAILLKNLANDDEVLQLTKRICEILAIRTDSDADVSSEVMKEIKKLEMHNVDDEREKPKHSGYISYPQDLIRVEHVKNTHKSHLYTGILDVGAVSIGTEVRNLLRVLSKERYSAGYTRGKVNTGSLYSVKTGKKSVFKQKDAVVVDKASVSVLIDLSGSMAGSRLLFAAQAALLLSEALKTTDSELEIAGFTDTFRHDALHYRVFSQYGERVPKHELAGRLSRCIEITEDNADADALLVAYSRLVARKNKRKILIVMSDGAPCGGYKKREGISGYTYDVIKQLEKSSIEVYALGIQTEYVDEYYNNSSVLEDSSTLPKAILNFVKQKLIK